jgi:hypothetical protein
MYPFEGEVISTIGGLLFVRTSNVALLDNPRVLFTVRVT